MVCKNTTKKIDHYFFAAAEKSNLLQTWMTKNKLFLLSLSLTFVTHGDELIQKL